MTHSIYGHDRININIELIPALAQQSVACTQADACTRQRTHVYSMFCATLNPKPPSLLSGMYLVFKMPGYPTLDNCAIQGLEL